MEDWTAFFQGTFYVLLGKEVLWGKKFGRIKELIFANVCWNVAEQTIAFTKKKSSYNLPK